MNGLLGLCMNGVSIPICVPSMCVVLPCGEVDGGHVLTLNLRTPPHSLCHHIHIHTESTDTKTGQPPHHYNRLASPFLPSWMGPHTYLDIHGILIHICTDINKSIFHVWPLKLTCLRMLAMRSGPRMPSGKPGKFSTSLVAMS